MTLSCYARAGETPIDRISSDRPPCRYVCAMQSLSSGWQSGTIFQPGEDILHVIASFKDVLGTPTSHKEAFMTSGTTKPDVFLEDRFRVLTAGAILLFAIATLVYHSLEGWSWVNSLYFSAIAVTTVGFGDLAPSTDASKLFTVFYVLSGIAVITTCLNLSLRRVSLRISRHRPEM